MHWEIRKKNDKLVDACVSSYLDCTRLQKVKYMEIWLNEYTENCAKN